MAGTAAVGTEVFRPIEGLAAPRSMDSNVYGTNPCGYALHELMQDATNNGGMALGNPVFAPNGDRYCIKLHWRPKEINVAETDIIGGMTFRASNSQNFYYLVFYQHGVAFARIVNNVGAQVRKAKRKINRHHPATFDLELDGSTFSVRDLARPGSPTILAWTDPQNAAPHGDHLDHWTKAGVNACWEHVHGKPMS